MVGLEVDAYAGRDREDDGLGCKWAAAAETGEFGVLAVECDSLDSNVTSVPYSSLHEDSPGRTFAGDFRTFNSLALSFKLSGPKTEVWSPNRCNAFFASLRINISCSID